MMIEIRKSITKKLKTEYPSFKIYREKVAQGLVRPCFFVDLLPIDFEEINPELQRHLITVDIQYMSLEDTKEKNLEMASVIPQFFTYISLDNGTKIQSTNNQFEIIDGILHFLFDLDFIVKLDITATLPNVGQVNLN